MTGTGARPSVRLPHYAGGDLLGGLALSWGRGNRDSDSDQTVSTRATRLGNGDTSGACLGGGQLSAGCFCIVKRDAVRLRVRRRGIIVMSAQFRWTSERWGSGS